MSLTQFKIEKTGELFNYDNAINSILNASGVPLGLESELIAAPPKFYKTEQPKTIKVILGHACNYSCSYCMQKDIGDPTERPKNIMTKELIKKMKAHLDLSHVERIELWGGETFLYWNDIVEIITALDRDGLTWYLPTNGTILKIKHPHFFAQMKGKVQIGISHDGPGHESLRGPEFLDRKVDVFRSLSAVGVDFSFNAVISSTNYDLFKINDYFRNFLDRNGLNFVPVVYELGRTYETGACATDNHVIGGKDIPIYREILLKYLRRHLEEFKSNKQWDPSMLLPTSLFHFGNGVLPYARSLRTQSPIHHYSNCGTDFPGLITLDMNGALRTCQNTNEEYIYGHVANIAEAKMQKVDYSKDDFCKDCNVLRLCNRSCPIKLPFETFLINHAIENVHYGVIQQVAFELLFDSPVTKVS